MATYFWIGKGGDSSWSDSLNWQTYVLDPVTGDLASVNGVPGQGDIASGFLADSQSSVSVDTQSAADVAEIDIAGGNFTLGVNLSFSGILSVTLPQYTYSLLDLGGHSLTLSGSANRFDGALWGSGTLLVTGALTVFGLSNEYSVPYTATTSLVYDGNPAALEDAGTVIQYGGINLYSKLGDDYLQIDPGAIFTMSGSSRISTGSVINNGVFNVTGDDTLYNVAFTNNGVVNIESGGTLNVFGGLDNLIEGAGELILDSGGVAATTTDITSLSVIKITNGNFALDVDLTYANEFDLISSGGNDPAEIYLNGHNLTLAGHSNTLSGVLEGTGTLLVTGAATIGGLSNEYVQTVGGINGFTALQYGAASTLEDAGTITQTGRLDLISQLGDGELQIDAGASYILTNNAGIRDTEVVNNGSITIAGDDTLDGDAFTNNGTLTIDSDATLALSGTDLGGSVLGSGALEVISAGSEITTPTVETLSAIDAVSGAISFSFDLNYSGAFSIGEYGGTFSLNGHTVNLSGTVSDDDKIVINNGGKLDLTGSVSGFGYINLASTGPIATLQLGGSAEPSPGGAFALKLGNFGDDAALDLTGLTFVQGATATVNGSTLRISSGGVSENYTLTGTNAQAYYATSDGGTGTLVTDTPPCFVRGTRILTESGEVAVEDLHIGARVVTASGASRPIAWLGRRSVDPARHADPSAVHPVRVAAHSFGEGLPKRDLWLSPGHRLACEGALMPVSALVNGVSVQQVEATRVEYWHVEFDSHDVLFAEGLLAESYLDTGNRAAFDNGALHIEAHPHFPTKLWPETCLPLHTSGRPVFEARERLFSRLSEQGFWIDGEADAHLLADGRRINAMRLDANRLAFVLPESTRKAVLASRVFVPMRSQPKSDDTRRLGLCIGRLQIDGQEISLDDEAFFAEGWHALERFDSGHRQRWTDGAAQIIPGARVVILDLAGHGFYWHAPAARIRAPA